MKWWLVMAVAGGCLAAPTTPVRSASAADEYLRLAKAGNPRAQHVIAAILEQGGRAEEAVGWLRRAAERNDVEAQVELGDYYSTRDAVQAAGWYERASPASADAMWKLGSMYENGEGVDADAERALILYRHAARKGSAGARNSLGNLSLLSRDYASALHWYRLAARQGFGEALLNLAGMYLQGLGVRRDYAVARRYAAAAQQKDVPDAGAFLAEISRARARR